MKDKLVNEIESFQTLWKGGFYAGEPSNPVFGLFGLNSFLGVSHVVYLMCIKPYIDNTTSVIEIGCGRGAWTKLMLGAQKITCLDALTAQHNGFYEYIGKHPHIEYHKVNDFSMREVPENSINFVFSYDALCHVSLEGISEYAKNMYNKITQETNCFWMVADYEKYNNFIANIDNTNVLNTILPSNRDSIKYKIAKKLFKSICR